MASSFDDTEGTLTPLGANSKQLDLRDCRQIAQPERPEPQSAEFDLPLDVIRIDEGIDPFELGDPAFPGLLIELQ